jgi:hypothetical protein
MCFKVYIFFGIVDSVVLFIVVQLFLKSYRCIKNFLSL